MSNSGKVYLAIVTMIILQGQIKLKGKTQVNIYWTPTPIKRATRCRKLMNMKIKWSMSRKFRESENNNNKTTVGWGFNLVRQRPSGPHRNKSGHITHYSNELSCPWFILFGNPRVEPSSWGQGKSDCKQCRVCPSHEALPSKFTRLKRLLSLPRIEVNGVQVQLAHVTSRS